MAKFYCPWCEIYFGDTNGGKVAKCPICKRARDDDLNQISPEKFQCIICGCSFSNISKRTLVCPDKSSHTGGKNEKK